MDKIKINNQVVTMRKFVKQAKVHSINRLVKQMKLLQNRKGDEAKVEKCKRKAERFREEIALLKSIKPDDVSKSALSKARDWKEILQQKTSTLNERCLAMLASYEAVQKEVESFHSSNPNLVTKIPSLVKEWEEKSKLPKNSPFDKQKKRLERYNPCKESNISSNALDKEVLPSSVKKVKVGVHDDLNDLEDDSDVMKHSMSIEDKEHNTKSLKSSKNQSKFNSSKLLKKISPLKLYENIESDMYVNQELESDDDIAHEYKKCKAKNMKKEKNLTKQKIKSELISNKLQSKIFPVKFSKNVQSDKSSDKDFRSDSDVEQGILGEGNENKFKRVRKSKDQTKEKIKIDPIKFSENVESDTSSDEDLKNDKNVAQEDNKLQSKNYHAKLSKIFESDKSSDEELCIDGEDSTNNTDLEETDSERNISESESSENMDQNNTVEIKGKFNENNQEQLNSDNDESSDFFLRIGRQRKLSENKNLSSKVEAGKKKYEKILLEKPTRTKQIQSNLSLYTYKNTKENNLKTITVLNLNDLQGFNEIPVEEKIEPEENSDKDEEKLPAQKRKDPFFLGRDELDPTCEDKVNVYSSNEKRQKFLKNGESNFEKKSFQKSLNTSQFSRREPNKFNNERNFKRGGFQLRNSADRFQHKGKIEFQNKGQRGLNRKERRAIQSRNQGDLYTKGKIDFQPGYQAGFDRKGKNDFQAFGKKTHDEQSRKSNFQKEENSSFRKDRIRNIKDGVTSEKPLHPSWEAKRKQKELTQTQFQGKKMVFND